MILSIAEETKLAFSGELQAYLDRADEAVLRAAKSALLSVVLPAKERLRDMVVSAGLSKSGAGSGRGTGRSLASAIRYEVYPKGPRLARDPAAFLYIQPSALHIFTAFEEGATVNSGSGKYLTIPIPGSPASRAEFGDKPRGMSVLDKLKSKGIEIAFVPGRNGKPAMLVGKSVRLGQSKTGRMRVSSAKRTKAGALAAGATSVPLFWLVPTAKIPKRLSLQREFTRTAEAFFQAFTKEFAIELAKVEQSQRMAA